MASPVTVDIRGPRLWVSPRGFWIWLLLTPPTAIDLAQDLCHTWTMYCSDVCLLHFLKYRSEQVTFPVWQPWVPPTTYQQAHLSSIISRISHIWILHTPCSLGSHQHAHPHCTSTPQKCCQALPRPPSFIFAPSSGQPPPLLIQLLPSHPPRPK